MSGRNLLPARAAQDPEIVALATAFRTFLSL
jgi:hypothetical protein